MSGRIPRQFIDELLVRIDIVDLIDSHLPLKKTGNNFVALCPFHNEKTPSFSVNRTKQIYHCFGCGASGNAISFIMNFNHLEFLEAVEDLATFLGLEVPKEVAKRSDYIPKKQNGTEIYDILEKVSSFYSEYLWHSTDKTAAEYLKKRQVSYEIANQYALGYSPNKWDSLANQFDRQLLTNAGLLITKEDGKTYDRFRGRLMFPIRDKRKRIIGFGGRVLEDSQPKYLNSPETAVFSKGKELYGLFELLEQHSRPKQIIIVEGYMDVIALAQFGISNAVAALGTATSKTHLDLLFRFTSELIFCFDGDQAGRQAAWKATETALPCLRDGRQIKIMLLPQAQDPDSLIRSQGLKSFEEHIANAEVLSDYFFGQLGDQLNLKTVEGLSNLLANARPQLEKMPRGFFREMMFQRLRELTGYRVLDVTEKKATLKSIPNIDSQPSSRKSNLMRTLLSLLLQYPYLAEQVEQQIYNIDNQDFAGLELFKNILDHIDQNKPENSGILIEAYRDTPQYKTVIALANLTLNVEGQEAQIFSDSLSQLNKQAKKIRMDNLIEKARRGEKLSPEEAEEFRTGGK